MLSDIVLISSLVPPSKSLQPTPRAPLGFSSRMRSAYSKADAYSELLSIPGYPAETAVRAVSISGKPPLCRRSEA
jgi:hypothetical protein